MLLKSFYDIPVAEGNLIYFLSHVDLRAGLAWDVRGFSIQPSDGGAVALLVN